MPSEWASSMRYSKQKLYRSCEFRSLFHNTSSPRHPLHREHLTHQLWRVCNFSEYMEHLHRFYLPAIHVRSYTSWFHLTFPQLVWCKPVLRLVMLNLTNKCLKGEQLCWFRSNMQLTETGSKIVTRCLKASIVRGPNEVSSNNVRVLALKGQPKYWQPQNKTMQATQSQYVNWNDTCWVNTQSFMTVWRKVLKDARVRQPKLGMTQESDWSELRQLDTTEDRLSRDALRKRS